MSAQDVIHAYRHLYRGLLRAVQYSTPGRYTARDQLRKAFREPSATLDKAGVKRTIWFLKAAQKEAGMEHRILRNLLMVAWHRESAGRKVWRGSQGGTTKGHKDANSDETAELAYRHYDMTVAMLNKTMGLCLH